MEEDTTLQSNEKSTAFVPLSSVFRPKESKISRLGDASGSDTAIKAEPGASFANGANTNYNVFQPDEFQNILDSAALGKPRNAMVILIIRIYFFILLLYTSYIILTHFIVFR